METYDFQIIANCLAGKGRAKEELKSIKRFLRLHGKTYTSLEILKPTPISQIPQDGSLIVTKGVICIGGDGTVSETIELMLKRNWNLPIFIIPTGTANFIANSIGVRTNISYDKLLGGKFKEYDLGVCESQEGKDYFLIGIGLGFEQKFLEMAKQHQKKFLGKISYFLAALLELFKLHPLSYQLISDGLKTNIKSTMLTILNLKPKITTFLPLFPEKEITPEDGFLDIIYVEHKNYFQSFLGILFFHLLGGVDFGFVKRFKAKEVEIISQDEVKSQIDGEVKGKLPFRIRVIPKKVRFLV